MKIEKLVIFGFGKHQDRTIEVGPELSIFFGTNEAGKTTIQQFIIQTLFGYPTKNQNLRRYEPKNGGKYGGQVHIQDRVYGRVVIERIKGKASGDVTLYFEDGTRGSEAELKAILRDYDRASFESVFSFSIHELQGLEEMTEEELSRTLLASGTTGMDAIGKLESRLEKEMGEVFKKNGRNPEINQAVEELRALEMDLKEHRSQMEMYEPYLLRTREIDARLAGVQSEETALEAEMKGLERWLQAAPLLEKRNALQAAAEKLRVDGIPLDGRRRMDRLVDRLSEVQSQLDLLQKEPSPESEPAPADTEQLARLLEEETGWHQLQSTLRSKQEEAIKISAEQNRLLALIGMGQEEAMRADVSLNNEERLLTLIEEVDVEEEENRFRTRKLADEKAKLAEKEKELKFFLSGEPSERERAAAEEWMEAAPKLAEAKAAGQFRDRQDSRKFTFLLIGIGLLGITAGIIQGNYVLAAIALLAGGAGLWQFFSGKRQEGLDPEYDRLLSAYGGREAEFRALIAKLDLYDRRLDELLDGLEAAKHRVAALSQQPEKKDARLAYQQFLERLGLQPETGRKTILELFSKLREIHALHLASGRLQEELGRLQAEVMGWLQKAESACGKTLSADGLFTALRWEFGTRQEKNSEAAKRHEKMEARQAEWNGLHALALQIRQEQQNLIEEAGAANIEAFYAFCSEWEQLEDIRKELAPIQTQLTAIGELPDMPGGSDAAGRMEELEIRRAEMKRERHALLAEQADKLQAAKTLLSGGEYEEKLQQYEEQKVELAELAKRWSIDKAIAEAIRQTLGELKEKKLPSVIEAAQAYFGILTGNAYHALEMNPQGFFEAVREDGMRFHIAELSQATKEQAYISLRLSLAVSMKDSHPFPIIMDDPFVHFDRRRLQHVINLITELQQHHQFIYFTCHESMRQAWPKAALIDVALIERSVHS
jgi:uncharacterized protein YhaN